MSYFVWLCLSVIAFIYFIFTQIVCKQLGFKSGVAYGTVDVTFMPSWIIDMNCTGTEKSLEYCVKGQWGRPVRSCKPAYALCYKKSMHKFLQ